VRHTRNRTCRGVGDAQQKRGHAEGDALRFRETERMGQRHVVARARHQCLGGLPAAVGGHEDREEAAAKPAAAGFREVEMTERFALKEGALGRGAAAAEQPQENVVVAVEDRDRGRRHGRAGLRAHGTESVGKP
jgi:hypothetical protein